MIVDPYAHGNVHMSSVFVGRERIYIWKPIDGHKNIDFIFYQNGILYEQIYRHSNYLNCSSILLH